jgi:queuine tRNA-ribosyltransferase
MSNRMNNNQPFFRFELVHQSTKSRARVGIIHTPHGIIETPNFVGVGTNATIKALDSKALLASNLQLMFCNTYHLLLHPGTEIVKQAGGLHAFMNYNKPLITDSGGFQVFSLAYGGVNNELKSKGQKKYSSSITKISEEGVLFRSYRDGSPILLTPESSVQAQKDLGADIIIPFDELPPYHIDERALVRSLERTHRWEKRSLDEHKKNVNKQAMYAVIHGGINETLRLKSCEYLTNLPFDGYAIGGSLGKNRQEMITMLTKLMPRLPEEKPNHLLGIGDLQSIDESIRLGIDTFDSSHPTRCARHGLLFTSQGNLKILQGANKNRFEPIDRACPCIVCKHYTIAYIHHLFKANELTGLQLATMHNLTYMVELMAQYRARILHDEI